MKKIAVLNALREIGLVPVLRAQSVEQAIALADAIAAGGVTVLEVTMTVPGALAAIEEVAKRFGDEVVVGAGTVLDAETARLGLVLGRIRRARHVHRRESRRFVVDVARRSILLLVQCFLVRARQLSAVGFAHS